MSGIGQEVEIPGTHVFTGEAAQHGIRLNKLSASLCQPENRDALRADEEAFMDRFALTDEEKDMVRRRDWDAMIRHGGSIYLIIKIGGALGVSLIAMGAQMRGETVEQFLDSRPGRAALAKDRD